MKHDIEYTEPTYILKLTREELCALGNVADAEFAIGQGLQRGFFSESGGPLYGRVANARGAGGCTAVLRKLSAARNALLKTDNGL